MGSNFSLVAIEAHVASWVANPLELVPSEDEQPTITFAEARDLGDCYGVGTLGKLTLLVVPRIAAHEAAWKKLSKEGRVVAFDLRDDEHCCLHIYEDGKHIIKREETGKGWSPKHPFERLAKVKATDPKADFIRRVFARFTGMELDDAALQAATIKRYAPRGHQHDAADVAKLADRLRHAVEEPHPIPGEWAPLQWSHRCDATLERLHEIWAIDPETAKTWVPAVLLDVERWPASARELRLEHYERIVSGKATELDTLLAPAYRRLQLSRSGRSPKFRPRISDRFFTHPIAGELDHLDLGHTLWPSEAAILVARSERLANLVYLSLDRTHAGDDGIAALAQATQFSKLRRLNLYACQMSSATLPALSRAAFAPHLEALAIGGNKLGVDVASLARFANLQWLSLSVDDAVEAGAISALLESGALPHLARLDLGTAVADVASLAARRPHLVVHGEWMPLVDE